MPPIPLRPARLIAKLSGVLKCHVLLRSTGDRTEPLNRKSESTKINVQNIQENILQALLGSTK